MMPSTSSYHSLNLEGPTTAVPSGKFQSTTVDNPIGPPPAPVTDIDGNAAPPPGMRVMPPIDPHTSGDRYRVSGKPAPLPMVAATAPNTAEENSAAEPSPAGTDGDAAMDAMNCAAASAFDTCA